MDIIFLESVYKDYIWGGENLKKILNKKTPFEKTAESWEISSNENGNCKIKNKEFEGKSLKELFEDNNLKEKIFGKKCMKLKEFPLLVKFIDAKENLSIQVHPDDKYARENELGTGKTEMWYIIKCDGNKKIIGGLNSKLTKEELNNIIENDNIQKYLNYIDIKDGDSIYIPAGTVHAILKDTLICEIQQNSDITYRVYDWDRVDKNGQRRQLHKKQAIEVIKSDSIPVISHSDKKVQCQKIVDSEFFDVEKINCNNVYEECSDLNTFYIINMIEGNGRIETDNKKYDIRKGDSFLIPASLGNYRVYGNVKFLKSYIK